MTVTLTVTVEDYNDIPPVFGSSTYSFSIVDNTTGPVNVFTGVNSTDDDFAIGNRAVSYELDISRTLGWLDIDAMVCYSMVPCIYKIPLARSRVCLEVS